MQRVAPEPMTLSPAQMLYLATRAGAEALGIENETGDFENGKAADLVYLRLRKQRAGGSPEARQNSDAPERIIAALFTLAGAESVREVRVNDHAVFDRTNE